MTPYKGRIKIKCTEKTGCLRNIKTGDVQPSCMDCLAAVTQVVDLDGKVLFEEYQVEKKVSRKDAKAQKVKKEGQRGRL